MYTINLSILSQSCNYIPENCIVNLKQLSNDVVRIQLAEKTAKDKLPVVHANSKVFSENHKSPYTLDITMPLEGQNIILKARNFDWQDKMSNHVSLSEVFSNIARLIFRANDLETDLTEAVQLAEQGLIGDTVNNLKKASVRGEQNG